MTRPPDETIGSAASCIDPVFSLTLTQGGPDRLRLMAAVRALRPDLSPAEVKHAVDNPPVLLAAHVDRDDADRWVRRFRHVGAVLTPALTG